MEHVAHVKMLRSMHRILVRKPEVVKSPERRRYACVGSIKLSHREK